MQPILKITIATIAYGLVHSILASDAAKRFAVVLFGDNNYRAFYRPFYILQAAVSTGALFLYTARLRTRSLYYLVLGSLHEELRLHRTYGRKYTAYLDSGVPFFLPVRLPVRPARC
jgi:hypothetical protein